mgnify:CR=1 FL=1
MRLEGDSGLTVMELTHRLGLPQSTAHRIVEALRSEGFVYRDAARRVIVGPMVRGLAWVGHEGVRELRG